MIDSDFTPWPQVSQQTPSPQMNDILEACLLKGAAGPFFSLFSDKARPIDLVCAYTLFCRQKDTEAFALLESWGMERHILLDISSLHMMLRHKNFWGDRQLFAATPPENAAIPALIPARGNSKGIPHKNLVKLNGESLLEIAISKAKSSRFITRVIVDTDSDEIAQVALNAGAETLYMRPEIFAGDFSDLNDVRTMAACWMELMEGYWYDYFAVLTPPHPLWPVSELDKAFEVFFASKYTALVSATPTEFPWEAYYQKCNDEITNIATPKTKKLYARNGAFSFFSRRPNGHYPSSTYRKLYPTQFTTMIYPLSKEHGFDINTHEELYACRMIYQKKENVSITGNDECEAYLKKCNIEIPSLSDGSLSILIHYPEVQNEYSFCGTPGFSRLLKMLSNNDIEANYVICGNSRTATAIAKHFFLTQIPHKVILKRNGALKSNIRKITKDTTVLYLNGYAGYILTETILKVINLIKEQEYSFCTSLRRSDFPPQWVIEKNGDDIAPIVDRYVGFRQKIEDTYVQSNVLAGFGRRADHDRPFTDHVLLNEQESIPLISPVNLILSNAYQGLRGHKCDEEAVL